MAAVVNELRTNLRTKLLALSGLLSIDGEVISVDHAIDVEHALSLLGKEGSRVRGIWIVWEDLTDESEELASATRATFVGSVKLVAGDTSWAGADDVLDKLWHLFDVVRDVTAQDIGSTGPLVEYPVRLRLSGRSYVTRAGARPDNGGAAALVMSFVTIGDLWA